MKAAAILILAVLGSSAAMAASNKEKKGTDLICRNMDETGSRLARKRICMTRDEWAEQKRMMREEMERVQTRRIEPNIGG